VGSVSALLFRKGRARISIWRQAREIFIKQLIYIDIFDSSDGWSGVVDDGAATSGAGLIFR